MRLHFDGKRPQEFLELLVGFSVHEFEIAHRTPVAAVETGARIPVGAWYAPMSAGARVREIGGFNRERPTSER